MLCRFRKSGAMYVGNKMLEAISEFFSLPQPCVSKITAEDSITLAMLLAYLGILPRAMMWGFFNN